MVLVHALGALALLSQAPTTPPPTAEDPRPRSVLFYVIDTCRADRLSVYGSERQTTPFLERIAAEGVVFEQCRSQAPWTKPSVASLLTSKYPGEVGIYLLFQSLDDEFVTLPEVVQAAGYRTAGFSANPLMGTFSNYIQGFDHFVESTDINEGDPINFASGSAAKLNAAIAPWLAQDESWPQFVYVHSVDPHEDYSPAPEYLKQFADPADTERYEAEWKTLLESRPPTPGNHLTPANFEATGVDSKWFVDQGRRRYDADLLANDTELERLWTQLQDKGWGDDVILVVMSDHGEEFFEHGGTSHGYSLYDELLHVPLILYAPGLLPAGLRIDNPVRSLDVYPTLCDLLGIEPPPGLSGRSLVPLIEGDPDWVDLPVMSEKTEDPGGRRFRAGMGVAVSRVEGPWKLISNLRPPDDREAQRFELYDVQADPGELNNLAPSQPERVARMDAALMDWCATNLGLARAESVVPEAMDPKVLEQLRALGYLGGEEETQPSPDALPAMARAILEGDSRWTIYALETSPPDEDEEGTRFEEWVVRGRRMARTERRESLLRVLYQGVIDAEQPEAESFQPLLGILASHNGHQLRLVISCQSRTVRVLVDGTRMGAVPIHPSAEAGFVALFEEAGLVIGPD